MSQHFLIRAMYDKEVIGIAKIPMYHHILGTYHSRSSDSVIRLDPISEAEYTSYETLELFQVYKWSVWITPGGFVNIYDPNFYDVTRHRITRKND